MFCSRCGYENKESVRYCTRCGSNLEVLTRHTPLSDEPTMLVGVGQVSWLLACGALLGVSIFFLVFLIFDFIRDRFHPGRPEQLVLLLLTCLGLAVGMVGTACYLATKLILSFAKAGQASLLKSPPINPPEIEAPRQTTGLDEPAWFTGKTPPRSVVEPVTNRTQG
ncbi:MAG: zinc ribbon domain-containing protein [Acidobacteria bacterium]|nr:zinc ribbon domain-containing protein [Acidobacteriota bacterium]